KSSKKTAVSQSLSSFDALCKKRKIQPPTLNGSDRDVHSYKKSRLRTPDMPQVDSFKEGVHGDSAAVTKSKALSKIDGREKSMGDPRKSKTKFEKYLEMEMNKGAHAVDDLKMEEKLAKKLKVKFRKLGGPNDGINELLDYTSVVVEDYQLLASSGSASSDGESMEQELERASESLDSEEDLDSGSTSDGEGRVENVDTTNDIHYSGTTTDDAFDLRQADDIHPDIAEVKTVSNAENLDKEAAQDDLSSVLESSVHKSMKYTAPHLRRLSDNESEELGQVRRQIRGLLNRLSESNVESITKDISVIVQSFGRNRGTQMVSEEVLASCSRGPRGNEQYAAVFAAFIAGMASAIGIDFGAKILASIAKTFEEEYMKGDGLSLRNLALLLSQLCIFGVCSSDLIYDLLSVMSKHMMELDVATIMTILQCCGMKLRVDDPAAMKDFILSVQQRVLELKSPLQGASNGESVMNSKRMEFMLETICDIKNNKKKPKEDSPHHVRLKKWLQKLGAEEIQLRGLKWSKLLDPAKKGQWWLSGDSRPIEHSVTEIAEKIDSEALEAQKLLQLASAQRMNTEARRAIFCVIMSGEDYMDAFEKILRLDLPGKQDREIMRVLVDCCLQEKVFNKYYSVLASKLCSYDKNHKFTLQYCLWDHFKQLDSMELRRSVNLARFVAEMLASFSLSLALLKVVEFSNTKTLTPKRVMHFRLLVESIFEYPDDQIWNIFTRIAGIPELEALREGIEFFLKRYVLGMASEKGAFLAGKFKIAKKALHNVAGILK
ncbi:Nucleolar MIF4G domain-containing protein 1, partial [Nymphaea thermarum]